MKLYCGTYKKYNEGSLYGKWLDLDDYEDKDAFYAACKELHKDEDDPELMFQDCECDYDWEEKLYSECSIPENYWDLKTEMAKRHIDEEIFSDYWSVNGYGVPDSQDLTRFEDSYMGHYDSGEDYAEQMAEDDGLIDHNSPLSRYIDWERYWRDLTYYGYSEVNGHIFAPV